MQTDRLRSGHSISGRTWCDHLRAPCTQKMSNDTRTATWTEHVWNATESRAENRRVRLYVTK